MIKGLRRCAITQSCKILINKKQESDWEDEDRHAVIQLDLQTDGILLASKCKLPKLEIELANNNDLEEVVQYLAYTNLLHANAQIVV